MRLLVLLLTEFVITVNVILPFVFAALVPRDLSTPRMVVLASFTGAIAMVVGFWLLPRVWR